MTSVAGTPENGGSEPSIALLEVRAQIVSLIAAKGLEDRYAALLSQCRTRAAHDLIYQLFGQIAHWQLASGERVRKYRAKSGSTFVDAIEGGSCRSCGPSNSWQSSALRLRARRGPRED